jgi:anti-sigma B factor antagonist
VSELLSLAIQPGTRRTVVRVRGEIDLATAPKLRECLAGLAGDLVVDLSDVSFVDSQAIGLLLAEHHRREKIGDCLIVCGASAMAMRTFEVTGAVKLLNLEDEAPGDPRSEPAASVSRLRPGFAARP